MNRLRNLAGGELRIDADVLAHFQLDVLALKRLETGEGDLHRIFAGIQVGREVFAGRIRDQVARHVRIHVRDGDGGAGDDSAGLVGNGA